MKYANLLHYIYIWNSATSTSANQNLTTPSVPIKLRLTQVFFESYKYLRPSRNIPGFSLPTKRAACNPFYLWRTAPLVVGMHVVKLMFAGKKRLPAGNQCVWEQQEWKERENGIGADDQNKDKHLFATGGRISDSALTSRPRWSNGIKPGIGEIKKSLWIARGWSSVMLQRHGRPLKYTFGVRDSIGRRMRKPWYEREIRWKRRARPFLSLPRSIFGVRSSVRCGMHDRWDDREMRKAEIPIYLCYHHILPCAHIPRVRGFFGMHSLFIHDFM